MRKLLKIISGLVFALSGFIHAEDTSQFVKQAVELYEARHLDKENLNKSFEILKKAAESEPDNLSANYELSRVYLMLGDEEKNKDEKIKFYDKGIEYGKKAVKINDKSAEAHFWYMASIGRTGQLKGIFNALPVVNEVKKEIEKILKINPKHAGALHAKAMYYFELPGILGGSQEKSIELLK